MKKGISFLIAGMALTNQMAWAQSQNPDGSPARIKNEQAEGFASLSDLQDENSQLGRSAVTIENELQSSWSARAQALVDKLKKKAGPTVSNKIDNFRLAETIGLENKVFKGHYLLDANYQIVVEPNYRNGEQVRRDIYVFGVGASKSLKTFANGKAGTAIGGKYQIRLTFSRIFKGPNAKLDAIFSMPVMPSKLPLSADGIKDKIKVGDTLRVEILGNASLGVSASQTKNIGSVGVGASYGKEALFMLDIYRHSDLQTRIRLFGLKNRGTFSVSASTNLTPWTEWRPESSGRIEDAIKKQTNLGVGIGYSHSADIFHDFPIDTMMLDYLYKFASAQSGEIPANSAEAAINEILGNSRRIGLMPLFSLLTGNDELDKNMQNRAPLSAQLAKEDFGKGDEARVRQLFKGRITSTTSTIAAGVGLTKLVGTGNLSLTQMKSFVESENALNQKEYHILVSASNNKASQSKILKEDSNTINDIDILMKADEKQQVTEVLDLITNSDQRDRKFEGQDLEKMQTALLKVVPTSLQTPALQNFLPQTDQTNAFYRSRIAFGVEALNALNGLTQPEISMALRNFIESHPDYKRMNLPKSSPETGDSYSDYMEKMARKIFVAINDSSPSNERIIAFNMLLGDELFQKYVLSQFFVSLLPNESAQKLAALQLQFSSNETPTKNLSVGANKISEVYQFVSFLRSVLNNRSYDLRLETQVNPDGTKILVTPELRGFINR